MNWTLDVFEMDTRVGGRGTLRSGRSSLTAASAPPRLVVCTWFAQFHKDPNMRTVVRWELTPTKTGTLVKLTHSGLVPDPGVGKDYAGGWPGVLEELKNFVERPRA